MTAQLRELLHRTSVHSAGLDALRVGLARGDDFQAASSATASAHEVAGLIRIRRATTAAAGVEFLGSAELLDAVAELPLGEPVHVHHFTDGQRLYATYMLEDFTLLGVTAIDRIEAGPIDATGARVLHR